MRSKSKKTKKPAYRRGEKLIAFLKKGSVVMLAVAVIAAAVLALKITASKFYVRDITVTGNYHIDKKDILSQLKVGKGDPLLDLKFKNINDRLMGNAWIKKVSLRKQFPGTLHVNIKEAVPVALLSIKKRLYIIDDDGEILEKIKGDSANFLPVIRDINTKNRKDMKEALKLVKVLSGNNMFADRESVEIGIESYGLSMKIDGENMKVGYGRYAEKFERWLELEPEIRKRGLQIEYVDLRFEDSIIVKPSESIVKEKTS